jgi:hypothetical protein
MMTAHSNDITELKKEQRKIKNARELGEAKEQANKDFVPKNVA